MKEHCHLKVSLAAFNRPMQDHFVEISTLHASPIQALNSIFPLVDILSYH